LPGRPMVGGARLGDGGTASSDTNLLAVRRAPSGVPRCPARLAIDTPVDTARHATVRRHRCAPTPVAPAGLGNAAGDWCRHQSRVAAGSGGALRAGGAAPSARLV